MSNRFPADDEHLHPYPGNLKHHKVSPAMERTIPEVYRAALATLESLIEDGYDHAKERQRKLLCEMMKDDAKSGLYNEKKRHPLLSDDALVELTVKEDGRRPSEQVRDYYEAARDKDAELIQQLFDALNRLVYLELCNAEGLSSGAPTSRDWQQAFDKAQQQIDAAAAAGFKPSEP